MRTLNLSGFNTGDNLTLSVSQGALTAGPVNVPSWGGGGDGGTITVTTRRSYRQIAPDSVYFGVDLSAATFDTAGPSEPIPYYDPRMHDLIYLWDMGDPGTWTAPENVLPAWKNRNVAKGPAVAHVYREPGDYTVSVLVIEPSSGKTATTSVNVTVNDPDDFYGDANTIYINNVGDTDFSHVPAGVPAANRKNVDSLIKWLDPSTTPSSTWRPDATMAEFAGGHAKRWLFKRGGSWQVAVYLNSSDTPDVTFGAYGDPGDPDPIWTMVDVFNTAKNDCLRTGYDHDKTEGRTPEDSAPDLRVFNINGRGGFDPVLYHGTDSSVGSPTFMRCHGGCNAIVVDCHLDGFRNSTIYGDSVLSRPLDLHLHLDNCKLTNFGGEYPVLWAGSDHPKSSVAFTGVKWEQPGDAKGEDGAHGGSRSPVRSGGRFHHARGCDVFFTDTSQPGMTFWKTPQSDGATINLHSLSIEGGMAGISMAGNFFNTPEKRSYTGNAIIDGLIYVGSCRTRFAVETNMTGVSVRNLLFIVPAAPYMTNAVSGMMAAYPVALTDVTIPDYVLDAPVKIYSSTFRMDRTMGQNSNGNTFVPPVYSTEPIAAPQPFTAVFESNNILHFPNLIAYPNTTVVNPEHIAFAPLSENILWTARCQGRRDPATGVLDTQYAVPADAVKDTKPLPGSAALGAALSGDVAYMDILMQERLEPPSKGAWEVA